MATYDLHKDSYMEIIDMIKTGNVFPFGIECVSENKITRGIGGTRQVLNKVMDEIFSTLFKPINNFFCDIDETNDFWNSEENIDAFATLIAIIIARGCTTPYHFTPGFLETITAKKHAMDDLSYYVKMIDYDIYKRTINLQQSSFHEIDSDYESKEELYRSVVDKFSNITHLKNIIGHKLNAKFGSYYSRKKTPKEVDIIIGGEYEMDLQKVKNNIYFRTTEYEELWNDFLACLTKDEMKAMIFLFTNSLSLDFAVNIYVRNITQDIKIEICFSEVTIKMSLFDNFESLYRLKLYFCEGCDDIWDKIIPTPILTHQHQ